MMAFSLQGIFVAVLVCVLLAAMASFMGVGLLRARRTRVLARKAYDLNLRFSKDDPFDLPMQYRQFALCRSGHSARASNVAHGRVKGRAVRVFDLRCESGHGPRRAHRYYSVAMAETSVELPPAVLWNEQDGDWIPLEVQPLAARSGRWLVKGSPAASAAVLESGMEFHGMAVSVQTQGQLVMTAAPVRQGSVEMVPLDCVLDLATRLEADPASKEGNSLPKSPSA